MQDPSDKGRKTPCRSCQDLYPHDALDRYLWCLPCREKLRRKTRWGPHLIALLITVPFGIWVARERKTGYLPAYAWLLPLAAAYYLGLRIGREVLKAVVRARKQRETRDEL